VIDTFRTRPRCPPDSLGAYVITMASRASDVLAVELLQKLAGNRHPQRVVPLFERAADLDGAGAVLDALFALPWYRAADRRTPGSHGRLFGFGEGRRPLHRGVGPSTARRNTWSPRARATAST
jgi:phosphoenolpyruvate carboxylase